MQSNLFHAVTPNWEALQNNTGVDIGEVDDAHSIVFIILDTTKR